ncbi:MAG: hypothetical protein N2689_02400, partial [Verrucomicrobiae bacterium]|nr:hypothetical protein [Verrucomicrobiae bacterium]
MKPSHILLASIQEATLFLLTALLIAVSPARAIESAAVKKLFARPPREYATAPLWVWNDMLTERQVRDTMRDLAGQHVK